MMAAFQEKRKMARRNKTDKNRKPLTAEETTVAAQRMMASAQAHQRTSTWCMDNPDAEPPNIDSFFFSTVSLELILISVEQSLRLLLLLHYSTIRDDTDHVPKVLYRAMLNKSGEKDDDIRTEIVDAANSLRATKGLPEMTEKDIVSCLERHNSSYTNFRHFQLNRQGKLNPKFSYTGRDMQILHCLALGLIKLNMDEMVRRNINVIASMSVVPESEMTDALRALKEHLA